MHAEVDNLAYYSPSVCEEVDKKVRLIAWTLDRIFKEREYDEWSSGKIDNIPLLRHQEALRHHYEELINKYISVIILLCNFDAIVELDICIKRAAEDKRYINTDLLPWYGEELQRSISRLDNWHNKLSKSTSWKKYWFMHFKTHKYKYLSTFFMGTISSLFASYLFILLY